MSKKRLLFYLILLTTFAIYSASLSNWFIWDDFHLVINEESIKSFQNLPVIFKTHLFRRVGGSNFYRPIQTLSFMFDYSIWKLNPFGYHLTNVIVHLLNILLVYFFVGRIFTQPLHARAGFKNHDIAFLVSLIFAIHPINTEAVTHISGRTDPISSFFFLAAFLFYCKFRNEHKGKLFLFSILCFTFSLLTKEAALIFPLVLILYDALILRQTSVTARSLKLYAAYFLIIFIYVFYRLFFLGLPLAIPGQMALKSFLLTTPKILVSYLWLLFFPIHLHMERLEPAIHSIFNPQAIISLIAIICIIWVSKIAYRRSKPLFFCISFSFITLFPMLNVLAMNAPMAEHWLYLPSIGIYSIVSFGLVKVLDLKKPIAKQSPVTKMATLLFIGFLSFFLIRTVFRNVEWGRPFEFYQNLLKYSPNSASGHMNIASLYISANKLGLARQEFQKAAELNPNHPLVYHGIGFLDYLEDDKDSAVENWKTALRLMPFYQPTRKTMSRLLYAEDKRFRKLLKMAKNKPHDITVNYELSKLYLKKNLYIEALDRLERILEIEPENLNALFDRAGVYSHLNLYVKATEEYERLLPLAPDSPLIYDNLAICYTELNRHKEADSMRKKALELQSKK